MNLSITLSSISLLISLILAVFKIKEYITNVKVTVLEGRIIVNRSSSEPLIVFSILNKSSFPIILESCGFYDKKCKYALDNPFYIKFPVKLEARRKEAVVYPVGIFVDSHYFKSIKGFYFNDETGHTYRARITKKMKKEWKKTTIEGYRLNQSNLLQSSFLETKKI